MKFNQYFQEKFYDMVKIINMYSPSKPYVLTSIWKNPSKREFLECSKDLVITKHQLYYTFDVEGHDIESEKYVRGFIVGKDVYIFVGDKDIIHGNAGEGYFFDLANIIKDEEKSSLRRKFSLVRMFLALMFLSTGTKLILSQDEDFQNISIDIK